MADTKNTSETHFTVRNERDSRLMAEESLRQSEELFRRLVEGVSDYAIFMLDPNGIVSTWNLGAERIKGYSAGEAVGQHFSIFYTEESVAKGWPEHELRVATSEGRFEDTGWRVRKDGSRFWANVIITAMHDGGRLLGFSKVTRDLTERKLAEEKLRQGRDLLEERVQTRTAELKQLEQELRQKVEELALADRRKNEFLATLAHELRNPLAPLRHALQLLNQADDDREVRRKARGVMERQIGQMVLLIDDLLDVSRITRNKLQLRKERLELATAIQSAVESIRPLLEASGHELTVALPPEPVYLDADPTRLTQIFTNLLNNAVKYTEAGGHIHVAAETQGSEVVVSVRDNGIGIAAEHLPHLFEMFSQVTPALERTAGGLGIGLALARGLVELHGGSIVAHSAGLGQGSELIVRLSVSTAPARAQSQPGAEKDPLSGAQRRILIADDNLDSVEILSMVLEHVGYQVQTAHDGLEAVRAAAAFLPEVALLDIGMPRLNGYEAARRIREQPGGWDIVLVAITGWGQEDDKRQAREAGFDHHLTKPVDPAELQKLLESVISTQTGLTGFAHR
ncbi:MAG TPA: ATP-binding protein [Thermoanaerobaculia bacterium]|jgi:PAS domain S-box-containing protein|nr:ATP-binding protein [Thermoanaerobaculia bacterium]